ncbi:glycosyltransferase [Planococcus sp. ISL-109]|uniref:glycosyltransferase n=1 Tax=Planococcus sp. ISL-109 TaxID=2819166 RepID=UPI001BE827AD|nr:glycosyltransferase [Planococcus sp. ISL-109]MBT2581300.1 glycosyltransferase [Planococcus sp. ISL-109]
MKVLHIISGGETGGSKKHLVQLLTNSPVEAELLLLTEGAFAEDARKAGIPVTVIGQSSRFDRSTGKKILSFLKIGGFSLVHSHGARANFLINSIYKKLGMPWFITVHSDPTLDFLHQPKPLAKIFTMLNQRAMRRADHLFAVSEKFKDMLIQMGVEPKKITSVFNGINFHKTLPAFDKQAIRESLGAHPEDFVFAIVARLHPVKGHDILLEAFAKTGKAPWKLWVIGEGDLRMKLEQQAEKLGLQDRVAFLGKRDDVDELLYAADVSLLTSHSESFPLVLLESADMATPVISTNVGGVPALVDPGKTGWIVEPGRADALMYAIEQAMDTATDTEEMGHQLRSFAKERFSNENLQRDIHTVYSKVLKVN